MMGVLAPGILQAQTADKIIFVTAIVDHDGQAYIESMSGMAKTDDGWQIALKKGQAAVFHISVQDLNNNAIDAVRSVGRHVFSDGSVSDVPIKFDTILGDGAPPPANEAKVISPRFSPGSRFRIEVQSRGSSIPPPPVPIGLGGGHFRIVEEVGWTRASVSPNSIARD